jgi:hypothetical protein
MTGEMRQLRRRKEAREGETKGKQRKKEKTRRGSKRRQWKKKRKRGYSLIVAKEARM